METFLELEGIAVLYGGHLCHEIAELLCVKSLAKDRSRSVVFIDAGNAFNPYRTSDLAVRVGLDRAEALRRIKINRVFTCFELSTLITRDLTKALSAYSPKLIVISKFVEPYCEREVQSSEAKPLFNRSLQFLARLSDDLPIVITHPSHRRDQRSILLERILMNSADMLLRVSNEGDLLRAALQRLR